MERDLDALWAAEHEKYPGMSKETFVRNHLNDDLRAFKDLVAWVKRDEALNGVVLESQWNAYDEFVTETDEDGRTVSRIDSTKTHVATRIGFEIVPPGGKPALFGGYAAVTQCRKGYWCSTDGGKDYLCPDCRSDPTPEQTLLTELSRHLADGNEILERIEALSDERGVQEAAAMREP